jgi:hypothetical protein
MSRPVRSANHLDDVVLGHRRSEHHSAAGYRVAGAATAAVAAQNLAAESGIASRTVAQWLWRINNV